MPVCSVQCTCAFAICDESVKSSEKYSNIFVLFSKTKSRNSPGIPGFIILNPEKPGWAKIGKNEGPNCFCNLVSPQEESNLLLTGYYWKPVKRQYRVSEAPFTV